MQAVQNTATSSGVPPVSAAESKQLKQARLQVKNRQYVLTPADYRERVVEPLVKQASKLFLLALTLGNAANAGEATAGDKSVDAYRKKFNTLKESYVNRLRKTAVYHSTLYRVAGKRAENVTKGFVPKQRESAMHRSISVFKPALYSFIREAAAQNESLRPAMSCAAFKADSPLNGYMSSTYAAQFVLAYVASNRRFNATNGQYIQPDALMQKHLGEGISKVLADIASNKDAKEVEKAKKFPGQFTFCKLQALIGFYRVKNAEGSDAESDLQTLRKDQTLWPVLASDFEAMSKIRDLAYARLHAENPKPVKVAGPKGPRGPLSEAQKHARRVKRDLNAAAGALDYEVSLVPRVPKAVPPTESSGATATATA